MVCCRCIIVNTQHKSDNKYNNNKNKKKNKNKNEEREEEVHKDWVLLPASLMPRFLCWCWPLTKSPGKDRITVGSKLPEHQRVRTAQELLCYGCDGLGCDTTRLVLRKQPARRHISELRNIITHCFAFYRTANIRFLRLLQPPWLWMWCCWAVQFVVCSLLCCSYTASIG